MVRDAVDEAVWEHNRFHGAEGHVRIVKRHGDRLVVRFGGPFCLSCSPEEYYVDFQLLLEKLTGRKVSIVSVKTEEEDSIVEFQLGGAAKKKSKAIG